MERSKLLMNLSTHESQSMFEVRGVNLQCYYIYLTCIGLIQKYQHGVIGMTVDSAWYEPLQNNSVDRNASNRAMEFELGW